MANFRRIRRADQQRSLDKSTWPSLDRLQYDMALSGSGEYLTEEPVMFGQAFDSPPFFTHSSIGDIGGSSKVRSLETITNDAVVNQTGIAHLNYFWISTSGQSSLKIIYGGSGTHEAVSVVFYVPYDGMIFNKWIGTVGRVGSPSDSLTLTISETLGGTAIASSTVSGSSLSVLTAPGGNIGMPQPKRPVFHFGEITLNRGFYYWRLERTGARNTSNYYVLHRQTVSFYQSRSSRLLFKESGAYTYQTGMVDWGIFPNDERMRVPTTGPWVHDSSFEFSPMYRSYEIPDTIQLGSQLDQIDQYFAPSNATSRSFDMVKNWWTQGPGTLNASLRFWYMDRKPLDEFAIIYGASGTQEAVAQEFEVYRRFRFDSMRLQTASSGSPSDNLVVKIKDAVNGSVIATSLPSSPTLINTSNFVLDHLIPAESVVEFTFPSEVDLAPGTWYFVVERTGARDVTNFWYVRYTQEQNFRLRPGWDLYQSASGVFTLADDLAHVMFYIDASTRSPHWIVSDDWAAPSPVPGGHNGRHSAKCQFGADGVAPKLMPVNSDGWYAVPINRYGPNEIWTRQVELTEIPSQYYGDGGATGGLGLPIENGVLSVAFNPPISPWRFEWESKSTGSCTVKARATIWEPGIEGQRDDEVEWYKELVVVEDEWKFLAGDQKRCSLEMHVPYWIHPNVFPFVPPADNGIWGFPIVHFEIWAEDGQLGESIYVDEVYAWPDLTTQGLPMLTIGVAEWIKDERDMYVGAHLWFKSFEGRVNG